MLFRRRQALTCRRAVELMSDYVEGALSAPDRARLETHLSGCPHCTEYLAQLRVALNALGEVKAEDLSEDALEEMVTLYRQWRAG